MPPGDLSTTFFLDRGSLFSSCFRPLFRAGRVSAAGGSILVTLASPSTVFCCRALRPPTSWCRGCFASCETASVRKGGSRGGLPRVKRSGAPAIPCGKPAGSEPAWNPRGVRGPEEIGAGALSPSEKSACASTVTSAHLPDRVGAAPSRAGEVCGASGARCEILSNSPSFLQAHRWSPGPECLLLRKGRAVDGGRSRRPRRVVAWRRWNPIAEREAHSTRRRRPVKVPSRDRSAKFGSAVW